MVENVAGKHEVGETMQEKDHDTSNHIRRPKTK
jgi:hypothetical protein